MGAVMSVGDTFQEVAAVNLTYFLIGLVLGLSISRALVWMERKAVNDREEGVSRFSRFRPTKRAVRVGYERLHAKVDCFDDYANNSADSQKIRAELNERDSNNQNDLLTKIAEINTQSEEATAALVEIIRKADSVEDLQDVLIQAGTSDAGDLTEVLDDFVSEKEAIEKARAENPPPDPPREVC